MYYNGTLFLSSVVWCTVIAKHLPDSWITLPIGWAIGLLGPSSQKVKWYSIRRPDDNVWFISFQCKELSELSNSIVRDSLDPLVLQPASLEIATIRKKPDEELVS